MPDAERSAHGGGGEGLVFFVLAVVVPVAARVTMPRPAYDTQVQVSLTLSAALAYLTLASLIHRRAL